MLLIASPLTRTLAITGTLTLGTGCSEVSHGDCSDWRQDCLEACSETDLECKLACEDEYEHCWVLAEQAEVDREQRAEAVADAAIACGEILVCTLESLGDGDGDGDGDDENWPPPDDADDWGEDWGEQQDDDDDVLAGPSSLAAPPDLPEG